MRVPYESAFKEDSRRRLAVKLGSGERARKAYEWFSTDMDVQGVPPTLVRDWFVRIVNRRYSV